MFVSRCLLLVCVSVAATPVLPASAVAKDNEDLISAPYEIAPPPPNSELSDVLPENGPSSSQSHEESVTPKMDNEELSKSAHKKDASELSRAPTHSKPITGRWQTPAGADMRETLNVWAEKAGVSLVWEGPEQFVIRDSIVMEGTFESAVAVLLEQYTKQDVRPVGDLHINPEGGQRTLIIQALAD